MSMTSSAKDAVRCMSQRALLTLLATMAAASATELAGPPKVRAIFSDLDGTIVHFPAWFEEHGSKIVSRDPEAKHAVARSPSGEERTCRLLPSSTMGDGLVSERTIELVAELRERGIIFVIVTAARKSTLFERHPLLPAADASVCETGSRIYRGPNLDRLDEVWGARFEAISGPLERELDVSERPEPLWTFFRQLQSSVTGLKCDSRSYYVRAATSIARTASPRAPPPRTRAAHSRVPSAFESRGSLGAASMTFHDLP